MYEFEYASIPVTPEPSFPADGYRKQAGSNFDIVCTINAIPITTFAGIFEVIDGVEVLVINATQQSDKTDVTVRYPIVDIQVDRHNRVFVCRATNRNGNESVNTTIQVFGKLNLSHQYSLSIYYIVCVSVQVFLVKLTTAAL